MPKYVIERTLPGAGKLTADDLRGISQQSCNVVNDLGADVQWQHTYVTDDKLFCVYIAANEEIVREHAKRGNFPCDAVREVRTMIDPATAEV